MSTLKENKGLPITLLLIFIAGVILAWTSLVRLEIPDSQELAARTSLEYRNLEASMLGSLEDALNLPDDSAIHEYLVHRGLKKYGFSIFIYENGELAYWSDNEADIASQNIDSLAANTLIQLNNGWYVLFKKQTGKRTAAGLLLIRKNYSYQNKYLANEFNPYLKLPSGTRFELRSENAVAVTNGEGKRIFEVIVPVESGAPEAMSWWQGLAIAMLVLVASRFKKKLLANGTGFIIFIFSLLLLRFLMIVFRWPGDMYDSTFFSPQLYASSFWFNSPGDLLLNSLLILIVAHGFFLIAQSEKIRLPDFWCVFLSLSVSVPLSTLISGLVVNSRISFDASNLFDLDYYTLAGILIIAIILFSYFYLIRGFISLLGKNYSPQRKLTYQVAITAVTIWLTVWLIRSQTSLTLRYSWIDFSFALSLFLIHLTRKPGQSISVNFLLMNILLFSLYSSVMIRVFNQEKELEGRKILISKLESNQDKIAEYLFDDVEKKISSDRVIRNLLSAGTIAREQVPRRISQLYLNGYWTRFEPAITCLDEDGEPLDSLSNWSFNRFLRYIRENGKATSNNYLYSVSKESGRLSYLSLIPITHHDTVIGQVLIRLDEKLIQATEGFPELFVSNKVSGVLSSNYSFARYSDGNLVSRNGDFSYFFSLDIFPEIPSQGEYSLMNLDRYNHLIYCLSPGNCIVISRKTDSLLIFFTLFSYLTALYSVIVFCYFFGSRIRSKGFRLSLSFKRRIQTSVLAMVVISILLIGGETIYFLLLRFDESQSEQIKTRVNSLSVSLESILNKSDSGTINDETWIALNQMATTLNSDFNLFSLNGKLLFSSQSKIFEQGIISSLMDPEALFEIREKGRTGYVQPENIGKLNYIAAYEPLRNNKGQIKSYLNLPYFEKQTERNKEISSFLSTLINTYVLLLALSVFFALLIATRITNPLRLIQEKIGNIKLGKRNEPIVWKREDEIGELVTEYNRMVEELAMSAEKLAQSEREVAWREMAKQVAHEIKNPLTPMKLSIQHLQRAWKENDPAINDMMERITITLVEQINSLSAIASAFSEFAQMPADRKEKVDLKGIMESVVRLFNEEAGNSIRLLMPEIECFCLADKAQLTRLFSNLIKNAIQAIPDEKTPEIEVRLSIENDNLLTSVQDNGEGIPKELVPKIFTPSFTTKSSGMGLGLAMAKRISENSGGKIWFETRQNSGSIFYVSLPKFQD